MLYILLAATGTRIREALAVELKHLKKGFRTATVEQQVANERLEIVLYTRNGRRAARG